MEPALGIVLIGVLIINIGVALLVVWAFAATKSQRGMQMPGQTEDAQEGARTAKTRKWAGMSGIAGTAFGVLLIVGAVAASDT